MGQEQTVHTSSGGIKSHKGARAGDAFASEDELKAKRKADSFRAKYRKSFAWKPPAKPGVDKDWDAYDPDKIEPPKPKAAATPAPKLTDIVK